MVVVSIVVIYLGDIFNSGTMKDIICRVKGKYEGQIRPKMGAPTVLSEELEADLALFVKHMQLLRVPIVREKLKQDIVHYCRNHRLNFPRLPVDGPGELSSTLPVIPNKKEKYVGDDRSLSQTHS